MIQFVVHGVPAPQGSKNQFGAESNPRTRPWRAAVTAEAAQAMNGAPLLDGPVQLRVCFRFPRPKSHYRTGRHAGELRADAPAWVASTPDLDKCARAIADSLSGVVYRDDRQIAHLNVWKEWGAQALAGIEVRELDGEMLQPLVSFAAIRASEKASAA